ncbi:nucleotidyltransferase domain-containing protein [soil metagenome]
MSLEMELARRIAAGLGEIEGVVSVALGGSRARGEGHPGSDIDLGIYYRAESRPSLLELHRLAEELGYRHPGERVTDFGGWGPWINGGAWLQVEGHPVDWLFGEIGHITRIMETCRAGKTAVHYQPGHPHGFHKHFYLGQIHYCRPLYDPEGVLKELKSLTEPYPPLLKETLIRDQLWEARFALETCRKPAMRGDAYYVAGCLFRCASCMAQALFALNERYIVNEKGSISAATTLPISPMDFEDTIHSTLANPGESPEQLQDTFRRLESLLRAVEELCRDHHSRPE